MTQDGPCSLFWCWDNLGIPATWLLKSVNNSSPDVQEMTERSLVCRESRILANPFIKSMYGEKPKEEVDTPQPTTSSMHKTGILDTGFILSKRLKQGLNNCLEHLRENDLCIKMNL